MQPHKQTAWNQHKSFFFNSLKATPSKCLSPEGQCTLPAIRSHSIPKQSVLTHLSEDGHVIAPDAISSIGKSDHIRFVRQGIHKATTFPGLCARHDSELFRRIDNAAISLEDQEQLFLLAYRATLKECYATWHAAMIAQGNYRSRVEKNLEIAHSESEVGMHATRAIIAAIRTKDYKELADAALTDSRNDHWEHKSIVLKEQSPTIALSTLITLDEYKSSATPLVAINIFPQEGEVIVLFSFTKEHEHHARHWCSKITEQCGDYQKYLISRMVLQHAENFVISPTYFDRMTESKKALLQQFFMMTLFNNDDTFDHPDLYLF